MIDYYDVLNINPDADEDDIKKAFKRASLQHHPDKQLAAGNKNNGAGKSKDEMFIEVKKAQEVLSDTDRRKVYDTFGIDLGEERPEMEIWTIGMTTLLGPIGMFVLRTMVARLAVWLVGFGFISGLLILCGVVALGWFLISVVDWRDYSIRSPDALPILGLVAFIDLIVALGWFWPVLADTASVVYLASEIVGLSTMIQGGKVMVASVVISGLLAWLASGWWWCILGFEVLLTIATLAALTVCAGIFRLWMDGVQLRRGDKLKDWRLTMRKDRKKLTDEVAELKKKLASLSR